MAIRARSKTRRLPYAEGVFVVLLLALLCVPLLELYVIIEVAGAVGTGQTIGLLILVSVAGAWMVRRSGLGVLNQIRSRVERGELPAAQLVDGLLILLAGALMLTPGFITDAVGLSLLFLPTRIVVRSLLMRHFAKRASSGGWTRSGGVGFGYTSDPRTRHSTDDGRNPRDVYDVHDVHDVREVRGSGPDREDSHGD